jgi:hypothetical protein
MLDYGIFHFQLLLSVGSSYKLYASDMDNENFAASRMGKEEGQMYGGDRGMGKTGKG